MNYLIFTVLIISRWRCANAVFKLQLVHTNDMHSRFDEADTYGGSCTEEYLKQGKCFGGFARVKQMVDQIRREAAGRGVPSIFLNAGDSFQGTPYYTLFKWTIVAQLIDTLGIDVMSLGNHEFDDGIGDLVNYLNHISIPTVACNLNLTSEPRLILSNLKPSIILNVNGTKIGVIGYLVPDTMEISNAEKLQIFDEIPHVQAEAKRLKKSGIKIIIALGHSGFEFDKKLAAAVPELSVIVGGHSHTLLYTPKEMPPSKETAAENYPFVVTHKSGKKIPIVQAYCNTKYLGNITITFDDDGGVVSTEGNTVLLDAKIKKDESVQIKVSSWSDLVRKRLQVVKGYTRVLLAKANYTHHQYESNVANLISDAYVDYAVQIAKKQEQKDWTNAPIGIIQIGGIRTSIDNKKNGGECNITLEDILTILPFQNPLRLVQLKGSTIKAALEQAVQQKNALNFMPYFLYASGMRIIYDFSKPPGKRLESATVLCKSCSVPQYEPLHVDNVYSVVMSDFLASGGDKYRMFHEQRLNVTKLNTTDSNAFIAYLERMQTVYPALEGRIVIKGLASSAKRLANLIHLVFIVTVFTHAIM